MIRDRVNVSTLKTHTHTKKHTIFVDISSHDKVVLFIKAVKCMFYTALKNNEYTSTLNMHREISKREKIGLFYEDCSCYTDKYV